MANKKISELALASTMMGADAMVLNQNQQTKQISVTNLFGSGIPVPVNIANELRFGSSSQLINTGTIALDAPVTQLQISGTNQVTLPNGDENQIKIIVAVSTTTGSTTSISGSLYNNSILFRNAGDTAVLMFVNGKWAFLSGTANVN